jgi:hypothetical protein
MAAAETIASSDAISTADLKNVFSPVVRIVILFSALVGAVNADRGRVRDNQFPAAMHQRSFWKGGRRCCSELRPSSPLAF